MIKYLIFLILAGGVSAEDNYWVCSQPGIYKDQVALSLAEINLSDVGSIKYEKIEELFEKFVKKQTDNMFEPLYSPTCRSFVIRKDSKKFLDFYIKQATKRNFTILWVEFNFKRPT